MSSTSKAALRRSVPLPLYALLAAPCAAQVPVHSALLLRQDVSTGIRSLAHVTLTPGSTPVPISGLAAPLDTDARQVAVDPTSGDVLVGTNTGDLWRVSLSGNTITSQTWLGTLTVQSQVSDIHRDATGAFLTVNEDSSGVPLVHRISLTPAGATIDFVAISGMPANTGSFQAGIATDALGNIVVGVRDPAGVGGTIGTFAPGGGAPTATASVPFHLNDVDVDPSGNIRSCGLSPFTVGPNVSCGTNLFQVGPTPTLFNFPFIAHLVSLPNGDLAFGFNGGGSGVRRVAMSGCTNGTESVVFANPVGIGMNDLFFNLRSNRYGSPCVDTGGNWPLITETTPPAIGTNWTVKLERARASTPAVTVVGTNNTAYAGFGLPLAFGGGCGLLSSADILQATTATDASGTALFTLAIPNTPGLIGTQLFAQWLFTDPGVNGFDTAMSSGLATAIQ
jgi:hypothetical protein